MQPDSKAGLMLLKLKPWNISVENDFASLSVLG
ncbi:MAG: hypothetical protein PWQ54_1148 [Bacteroidales bacterium]|jgi:hypothetical protein|nr:hypothetical protein [Bacteroidales bacterium]